VKFRDHLTIGLAVVLGVLALVQVVHPFGVGNLRISPIFLIVAAALLGARIAVRREARKREELLKNVPRRPLGL
jgi:uncharacterized membrane protein AbrB (regulator of aidB expression)